MFLEIGGLIGLAIAGYIGEKVLTLAGKKEAGVMLWILTYVIGSLMVIKWFITKVAEAFDWAVHFH